MSLENSHMVIMKRILSHPKFSEMWIFLQKLTQMHITFKIFPVWNVLNTFMNQTINQPKNLWNDFHEIWGNFSHVIFLVLWYVSDHQFEKHGSTTAANTGGSGEGKATSGQVVSDNDDDSFLSKLTSLKRKIFG